MAQRSIDPAVLLHLATDIALEAGEFVASRAHLVRESVETKSSSTDMVTEVDRASEALIVERIRVSRPSDGILGEEGASRDGTSGVRWVVDPLDGTTNFLYGFPAYAISIGVEVDGEVVAGVVHDAARGETFTARRGGGAFRDGHRIHVSPQAQLPLALVGSGFGYDAAHRVRQARVLAAILGQVRDLRREGSAALDLCSVACGRLDAYFEGPLNPWDVCAGMLIVREAGGIASVRPIETGHSPGIMAAGPALFVAFEQLIDAAVAATK